MSPISHNSLFEHSHTAMKTAIWSVRLFTVFVLLVWLTQPAIAQQPEGILWQTSGKGRVTSVAIGSESQQVAFGSSNNKLQLYTFSGDGVWTFEAENSILGVDLTPNGEWAAVASEDRHVYLLDHAGQPQWKFRARRSMNNAAIADDGSLVAATSNDRSVYALDQAGNLLWQQEIGVDVEAVEIYGTGDKARVVVGTDAGEITIYSRDGQPLLEILLDYAVHDLDVTGNGARIIAGTFDGSVVLLHGGNGQPLWQVQGENSIRGVAVTRRGEHILVGTDSGEVLLLDNQGKTLQIFTQSEGVLDVALSADGSILAVGTTDGYSQVWDRQAAAVSFARAATQRRWIIWSGLGVLLLAAIAGSWAVRHTASGRRIWYERMIGPRRLLNEIWQARLSYLFLLPTLCLLLMFNYYPAISGLYHAFTDWVPGARTEWVGLDNFRFLYRDRFFWAGFGNIVILVVTSIVKIVTIPLLVAELIFHIRNSFMQYWMRTLFIVPIVLPLVVQILVWNNIYDPTIGLLNQSLLALGLEDWTRVWYGDANVSLASIIFIGFPWVDPFALLVFYGGLISISGEVIDATKVDGATTIRRFWHVDLPLLFGQVKLLTILTFIAAVQTFELVFLTTGGGPGAATYTPALELYFMATRLDKLGVASAIGIILFVIILIGTIINLRYGRESSH